MRTGLTTMRWAYRDSSVNVRHQTPQWLLLGYRLDRIGSIAVADTGRSDGDIARWCSHALPCYSRKNALERTTTDCGGELVVTRHASGKVPV